MGRECDRPNRDPCGIPPGIPGDILSWRFDHRKSCPGDRRIRFGSKDEPALERVRSVYDDEDEETDYSLNAARGSRELRHAVDMKRRGIVAEVTKATHTLSSDGEVLAVYAEHPVTEWEVKPFEEYPLVAILRDVRTSRIVDTEALGFRDFDAWHLLPGLGLWQLGREGPVSIAELLRRIQRQTIGETGDTHDDE